MRTFSIVLGFISAILAVILSVLPLFHLAFIPAIAAFVFGLIGFYLANRHGKSKKIIQYIFLLTIISLSISTYKSIFNKTQVANTEELQKKEKESEDEAIEELEELDLDNLNVDE